LPLALELIRLLGYRLGAFQTPLTLIRVPKVIAAP